MGNRSKLNKVKQITLESQMIRAEQMKRLDSYRSHLVLMRDTRDLLKGTLLGWVVNQIRRVRQYVTKIKKA